MDSRDYPFQLLELSDGKYLIVGTAYFASSNSFHAAVCRMNSDDTIDLTFGDNGRVVYTWDQRNTCVSASLQEDGKILLGGYQASSNGWSSYRAYVARLNTDGSVDESFGQGGSTLFDIESGMKGTTVGIKALENGKILAAAITSVPSGVALYQLNEDGSFDTEFGENGLASFQDDRVVWQVDYGKALFLNDGSVVVVSKMFVSGFLKPYLCKFNSDGTVDSNFGTNGTLVVEDNVQDGFAGIHATLDADENVIVGSTSQESPKKYQVMKVSGETGTLISEFGNSGIVVSTNTDNFNTLHGLGIDPLNGDIYAVGSSSATGWQTSVWKINNSGEEVAHCNGDAMLIYGFQFMDGMRICHFSSSGSIKLVGVSDFIDDTTPEAKTQNFNFFVPITSATGESEIKQSDLLVYPNPVRDVLNIKVKDSSEIQSVVIRNQLGQAVNGTIQGPSAISTKNLPNGIYFIEVATKKGVSIQKFIKQ
jgi:uncharacterized delta-60 repeat protein